jgi:hypothetical protein
LKALYIADNESLSHCAIQSVCDYLQIFEEVWIDNNAEGCNNFFEVEEACMSVYIENYDITNENDFTVFPNPVFDNVNISALGLGSSQITISIYDVTGNCVYLEYFQLDPDSSNEIQLNLSSFSSGIYIVRMQTGKKILSKKIIKQ